MKIYKGAAVGIMLLSIVAFGGGRIVANQLMKVYEGSTHIAEPTAQTILNSVPTIVPDGPPPPNPAWVNPDGTVNRDKLPQCLHKLDKDGKREKDKNGKEICVPTDQLFGQPPSAPPSQP